MVGGTVCVGAITNKSESGDHWWDVLLSASPPLVTLAYTSRAKPTQPLSAGPDHPMGGRSCGFVAKLHDGNRRVCMCSYMDGEH